MEKISAQSAYVFNHLNTTNGLSSNNIKAVITDKNGYLWIATTEGLNRYDGYSITPFPKYQYPNIPSDNLNALLCDSKNRIWLSSEEGLGLIDENRTIKKIEIEKNKNFSTRLVIETTSAGIVVIGAQNDYSLTDIDHPEISSNWKLLQWTNPALHQIGFRDINHLSKDLFLIVQPDRFCILDFAVQKEIFRMELPIAWTGCRINNNELMIASNPGKLFRINLAEKKIVKTYLLQNDATDTFFNTSLSRVRAISDSEILVTTIFRGLYVFNPHDEKFRHYQHDPLNNYSLSENRTDQIFSDSGGNVFITTNQSGVNIVNNNNYKAHYQSGFSDNKGNIFDGYINGITLDKKQRLWMAAFDRLIVWDKQKNRVRFFPYYKNVDGLGNRALEIKSVYADNADRIWVNAYEEGVLLLNEQTGKYRAITHFDSSARNKETPLGSVFMYDLQPGLNGKIWVCNGYGIFSIDPKTLAVDINTFTDHPVLKDLSGKRIIKIWQDRHNRFWFGSREYGAFCYNVSNNTLKHYFKGNGLPSDYCLCFAEDNFNNIYIATNNGMAVISSTDSISVFNKSNGLKSNLCSGLMTDKEGNIWIANNNTMLRYSPPNKTFKYFAGESGFPNSGFRSNSFYQSVSGDMFWGTDKGVSFFSPQMLNTISQPLHVNISKLILPDSVVQFTQSESLSLPHHQNNLTFNFSAIDLMGSKNILYQYILEDFEEKWNAATDITQAKYGLLPPGDYTFKLKASRDGINWTDSTNFIQIRIAPPFWKTWWFKTIFVLFIAGVLYALLRWQRKRREEKEKLKIDYEKKIAAVEMNMLRAQMNPHFIFNSLNSINTFILKNDSDNATEYLQKFSSLVRLILENSRNEWILLENEIKALDLYMDLEAVRFENIFSYSIKVSPDISQSSVWVPPLIIQPYAENAIRHGLINLKRPGGKLDIQVWKKDSELLMQIEDNGIGRAAAEKMKRPINKLHQQSHGMKITAERLDIVNEVYKVNARVEVTDLNENGNTGTRVLITIQYKNHENNNN